MDSTDSKKPTKYYVDFENVHGAGLNGVDALDAADEVYVFYSQAAETFHIEHAISILNSKARIEFVEIDGGTRNSLDFQLVAALFGTMDDEHDYAIVSGDGGFDAAIKMGQRLELPSVRRITDLTGSTEPLSAKSTRQKRSRSSKQAKTDVKSEQKAETKADAKPEPKAESKADVKPEPKAESKDEQHEQPQNGKADQSEQKPATRKQSRRTSKIDVDKSEVKPDAETEHAGKAKGESKGAEKPDETASGKQDDQDKPANGERSGRYSKRKEVKAYLAENGVEISQQQLSSVMKALNGVKNKQGFYRGVIQAEKQEQGLELYRKVRDHYEAMVEILRS